MATYVISAMVKNGCFGCMVHYSPYRISNPDTINDYQNELKLMYHGKMYIDKNILSNSSLREIRTRGLFNTFDSRFEVEYGILNIVNFLNEQITLGDTIIFAGVNYIRPLSRGAIEPIEDFEIDIIQFVLNRRAVFTNTLFNSGLSSYFNNTNSYIYTVSDPKFHNWINQV